MQQHRINKHEKKHVKISKTPQHLKQNRLKPKWT